MTQHTEAVTPVGADPHPGEPDKPFGPINAALIAGGIGSLAMGVFTTLVEASTSVKSALTLTKAVGPLSGKTVFAVVVWLVAWAVLHATMRRSTMAVGRAFALTLTLVGLGLLLTFPLIFQAFAP
ncbi:MAG: hypothetical protein HYR62_01175 [Actinobacteria bacterium]|nr:hypothetical protein [Actinomycetota bacterium]MBI3688787.1 hypothetical protein [Actinomycetota bacterium]